MIRRLSFVLALAILGSIALVPSVAAGGGCYAPESVKLSSGDDAGLIAECAFQPTVNYIEPGEKVTWTNKDVFDHTVTGAASSWGSDASIAQGETVSFTFEDEGVYPYYCAYHPSMVGAVVVGDGMGKGAANAAILPADDSPPTTTEAAATDSSQSTFIAFGLGALGVIAALMTWRAWKLRRRHAPAVPSL